MFCKVFKQWGQEGMQKQHNKVSGRQVVQVE